MRRDFMSVFSLLASAITKKLAVKYFMHNSQMTALKSRILYLKFIKTARLLFLSFFGISICVMFLVGSLVLFHVGLLVYSPFTMQTKMLLSFASAAVYLMIFLYCFNFIFSEEKWMKMFHVASLEEGSEEEQHQKQDAEASYI